MLFSRPGAEEPGVGAQGARAPPIFSKDQNALFVQAKVAVNTKLISKVPFLFGNFDVFKKHLVKNVQFRYSMTGKVFSPPPPTFPGKFLGALFNIQ